MGEQSLSRQGSSNSNVCGASPLSIVVVVFFFLRSSFVCGEVMLITGMTTLHVLGDKVGVMTHKTTIIFLAPRLEVMAPTL